ncbi:MAG: hypothetical protein NTX45_24530 [Proteobacteria bacterium]|nr:hypothetical protein [Pseudomonadota bacterium]
MKTLIVLILGLFFSNYAMADYKEDILELCLVAKKGDFSQIKAKVHLQADGSIKLFTAKGEGEVNFSKGEWDGIQQVLKEHQVANNVNARDCVKEIMPYFKEKKISPRASTSKQKKLNKTNSIKTKSTSSKFTSAKPHNIQQESTGNISPNIISDGDVNFTVNRK